MYWWNWRIHYWNVALYVRVCICQYCACKLLVVGLPNRPKTISRQIAKCLIFKAIDKAIGEFPNEWLQCKLWNQFFNTCIHVDNTTAGTYIQFYWNARYVNITSSSPIFSIRWFLFVPFFATFRFAWCDVKAFDFSRKRSCDASSTEAKNSISKVSVNL